MTTEKLRAEHNMVRLDTPTAHKALTSSKTREPGQRSGRPCAAAAPGSRPDRNCGGRSRDSNDSARSRGPSGLRANSTPPASMCSVAATAIWPC
jgi:hypothetical protein